MQYNTFQTAYVEGLRDLKIAGSIHPGSSDPLSVGSRFGQQTREYRERFAASFELTDPRARLLNIPERKMNLTFAFAQVVWMLSGSDLVEPIAFYNPRAKDFSDDGVTLNGAYGKRLFSRDAGKSTVDRVIERLSSDSGSRRANIPILNQDDLMANSRDIPCTISFGFNVRGGALHMFSHMRSQSAAMVLPYDVFSATMIQELVARELNVNLGSYFHTCDSFQYYQDEQGIVDAITGAELLPSAAMPEMPKATRLSDTMRIVEFERQTRMEAVQGQIDTSTILERAKQLGPYWDQVALIISLQAIPGTNKNVLLEAIDPPYRELL